MVVVASIVTPKKKMKVFYCKVNKYVINWLRIDPLGLESNRDKKLTLKLEKY